jgi:hypothetical protein
LDNDVVQLHSSAHEHFRGSTDGAPRVVDVDSWAIRLWFDLVSKNMVRPDRTRSARHLIDIRPATMARNLPASYARKAFEDNFPDYLRKVRRIANPDRFGLYSVSEAAAERFGSIVFRMEEDLVFDPEAHLRPKLLGIDAADTARTKPLTTAILDEYRKLTWMQPSAAGLGDYANISGDTTASQSYGGTSAFSLARWQSLNETERRSDGQSIFGVSYLARNIRFFVNLIESLSDSRIDASRRVDLVWYRTGDSGWGQSPELQEAISSLKNALRRRYDKIAIRTKLVFPSISRREHPERFRNLFDEASVAPAGFLSPTVEVVHIVGIGVLALVNVALSETSIVPVGIVSTANEALQRADKHLRKVDAQMEELWNKREPEEPDLPTVNPEIEDPNNLSDET